MICVIVEVGKNIRSVMGNKIIYKLPFLLENKRIFEALRDGRKKIETRAGSQQYLEIKADDTIEFSCAAEKFSRIVKKISHYKNLDDLFDTYTPNEINPEINSYDELKKCMRHFPDTMIASNNMEFWSLNLKKYAKIRQIQTL